MKYVTLYHWTHKRNLRSIMRRGLSPAYSESRIPRVWACKVTRIAWALSHVSSSHGWDADTLVCIRISVCTKNIKRTGMRDVFTRDTVIPPECITGVLLRLGDTFTQPA